MRRESNDRAGQGKAKCRAAHRQVGQAGTGYYHDGHCRRVRTSELKAKRGRQAAGRLDTTRQEAGRRDALRERRLIDAPLCTVTFHSRLIVATPLLVVERCTTIMGKTREIPSEESMTPAIFEHGSNIGPDIASALDCEHLDADLYRSSQVGRPSQRQMIAD